MASFLEQYWNFQRDADSKYKDAVVLIEKGSFMECYSIPDGIGRAGRVAQVLNMIITKCNKNLPTSETNPHMVGFPKCAHDKNVPILIASGMTVVWVEQKWDPWRKAVSGREVTRIITPGTYHEHPPSDDGYHIGCVYSVSVRSDATRHYAAVMDTSVGTLETVELEHDDDLLWFANAYSPREMLCIGPTDTVRELFGTFYEKTDTRYTDTTYQTHRLNQLYPDGVADIRPVFRPAVVCLLDFVHTCHPKALNHLTYPKECYGNHMSLHNNAVAQLDLLPSERGPGVFGVLNKTRTAMGKRLLKRQLLRPHVQLEKIHALYEHVDSLLQGSLYKDIQQTLSRLPDMERLIQRVSSEPELAHLHKAIHWIHESPVQRFIVHRDVSFVKDHWDRVWDCDTGSFREGYDSVLDERLNRVKQAQKDIDKLVQRFGIVKLECKKSSDTDLEYQLVTTAKKGEVLKKQFPEISVVRLNASGVKVVSDEIQSALNQLSNATVEHQEHHRMVFQKWRDTVRNDYGDILRLVSQDVARVDCACSKAECAVLYKQVRPQMLSQVPSQVVSENLKHPLLENYVGNDCRLDDQHNGVLLYGINGAGKSCYSKSIAINLIMAQSGFYVCASSFRYAPFTRIFTRIQCDDNVYKGMSSFTVEMHELRSILRLSDERSLVIGDELCKGTEDLSAVSLVAASIKWMSDHHVKYVFATHLHKLPSIDFVKNICNLRVMHMASEYNAQLGKLVFLRKLEPGQGDPLYGIEMARQILGVPEVANMAMMARQQLTQKQSQESVKKSRYNKKLIVDRCAHCHDVEHLHTHHIQPQQQFSKDESKRMNHKDNLIVLCQSCHDDIHHGSLRVQMIDTVQGKLPLFTS